eukprot:2133637-Prymnesium_polylepis.1
MTQPSTELLTETLAKPHYMGTAPAKDARIAEAGARGARRGARERRRRHGHDRRAFVSSRASSRQ